MIHNHDFILDEYTVVDGRIWLRGHDPKKTHLCRIPLDAITKVELLIDEEPES